MVPLQLRSFFGARIIPSLRCNHPASKKRDARKEFGYDCHGSLHSATARFVKRERENESPIGRAFDSTAYGLCPGSSRIVRCENGEMLRVRRSAKNQRAHLRRGSSLDPTVIFPRTFSKASRRCCTATTTPLSFSARPPTASLRSASHDGAGPPRSQSS